MSPDVPSSTSASTHVATRDSTRDAALRQSVAVQSRVLAADPARAIVRPWVRTELERGVIGVSRFTQYGQQHEFRSDEALDRGGEASAPSPLRYLLSGVAFCLQGWCAKTFAVHQVALDALQIELRTRMDMRGELLVDSVAAHPQWLVAHLTLASPAGPATLIALVREAAARCPLSALLARALPLYLLIEVGGVTVLDERPPELQNEQHEEQTR